MPIIEFKAARKWAKLPKDIQELLINNVFCMNCGVTRIVDYDILHHEFGILLQGKCIKCGNDVVRLVEDE
jgi:predicted nucleic-acid-binding Zn-ribbon protein